MLSYTKPLSDRRTLVVEVSEAEAEELLTMPQQPIWLHERLCQWLSEDRP